MASKHAHLSKLLRAGQETVKHDVHLEKYQKIEEREGEVGFRCAMKRKVVVVCLGVGFLGLLSAVCAFAAEATRIKASNVRRTRGECVYPRSPALALGLISVLALMIAQGIVNVFAGCICCRKHPHPSGTNWTVGLVSFIASWVSFIIAFLLLFTAAALNGQQGNRRMYFGEYCFVVRPGVFAGGAVLSIASVALGIVYYIVLSSMNGQSWGPQQNQGIALAHPQVPAQAAPVFVHEDTFNRQQFP
ncbi:hypothetical protein Cni_G03657 [Canna indica]|uniref:Uncharacterized protein n=1 Tax=Canna indica TaxID=4628 RepID=A0AAQ3JU40_9LILI|nr:hypothetical protein Cni_G03657 [Canna indica]